MSNTIRERSQRTWAVSRTRAPTLAAHVLEPTCCLRGGAPLAQGCGVGAGTWEGNDGAPAASATP